jgi:septal ring factor EnvC (AmiA/AmiB activator)
MASTRVDRRPAQSAAAVSLVECSVRVSSTLARSIRKIAEQERQGLSASDAVFKAAGIQPGEIESLRKQVQRAHEEARELREKAARDHRHLDELRTMLAQQEKQKAAVASELRETTDLLQRTRQEMLALEARLESLTIALDQREKQLAHSISVSELDEASAAATKLFRDLLAEGSLEFTGVGEGEAMISNLGRPEMRNLSKILSRRTPRIRIIRWLLGVPASG